MGWNVWICTTEGVSAHAIRIDYPLYNNSEIRILKEKHQALWKFLVLIDRAVWDCQDAAGRAAQDYFRIPSER